MADELIAGRYRLLEPLGRGAMSSVWLAEDEELGRRVAVKTLAPSADRARFEREARAAASLSHPNLAGVYDYGEVDGKPYMVLEYLPGGSLESRLREGTALPDAETDRLAAALAAGLAHAHERGLVHRDLKPANVLFDAEDRPKIADFGIARIGGAGTLTEAGTVLGTATYISPEQASGLPAGPASDVYSFGAMLFRMLTGRLPFVSRNAMELVRLHRDEPAPAVRSIRPDAPATLAAVADAALAKDPRARPADGAALAAALAGGDLGATVAAAAVGATNPDADATQIIQRRPAGRRPLPLGALTALAVLVLAAGAAAAWLATRGGDSAPAAPPPTTAPLRLPTVPAGRPTTVAPPQTSPAAPTTTTAPTTTSRATRPATTTTAPTTTRPVATSTALPTTTAEAPIPPPPTETAPPGTTTGATPTTTAATTTATTTTAAPPTTTGP